MSEVNINVSNDDDNINDYLHCLSKFGETPSRLSIFSNYKIDLFTTYISSKSNIKYTDSEIIPNGDDSIVNSKYFVEINNDIFLSYSEYDKNSPLGVISDITIYYKIIKSNDVDTIINDISSFIVDYQDGDTEQKFNILTIGAEGLQLDPIDTLNADYENIEMYYNDDIIKESKKITKSIKSTNKGLTVIYGERGVGKTTLMSYMLSQIERICIFVPSNVIDIVNSHEFKSFIKRYKNSIIIIDDCEIFFMNPIIKQNLFSNNLVQMVDGVSSDMDNLHIVTILNTINISDIDQSLLECNNYIGSLNITKLSKDTVDELCVHLNQKNKLNRDARLVDIIKEKKDTKQLSLGF